MDPYERPNITSDPYNDWLVHNVYLNVQGIILATEFIETFKQYPASCPPVSPSILKRF